MINKSRLLYIKISKISRILTSACADNTSALHNLSLLKRAFIAIIEAAKIYMSNSVFTAINPHTNKEITMRLERPEERCGEDNFNKE